MSRSVHAFSNGSCCRHLQLPFRLPLPPEVAIVEHLFAVGVYGPVTSFSWVVLASWYLLEAVVQGQVMPDGVLPACFALLVERKIVTDVLVDGAESQLPVGGLLDRHRYQRGV